MNEKEIRETLASIGFDLKLEQLASGLWHASARRFKSFDDTWRYGQNGFNKESASIAVLNAITRG